MSRAEQAVEKSTRNLADNLKSVIKGAEELLQATGQQVDSEYRSARSRFESTLQNAKAGLTGLENTVLSKTKDAAQNTDQYVQEHPWQSVGVGAFAGLIVGLMIGRK